METRRFADVLGRTGRMGGCLQDTGENHWQYAVCSHTLECAPSAKRSIQHSMDMAAGNRRWCRAQSMRHVRKLKRFVRNICCKEETGRCVKFIPGRRYRHFKGNLYQVILIARRLGDTASDMVVYQALYGDYGFSVRPYNMFASAVDRKKYPEAEQEYRFALVED